jgi:hypothetical protein
MILPVRFDFLIEKESAASFNHRSMSGSSTKRFRTLSS